MMIGKVRFKIIFILLLQLWCQQGFNQHIDTSRDKDTLVTIQDILDHPNLYDTQLCIEVFNSAAEKHLYSNLDSTEIIYFQMVDFGKSQKKSNILFSAYNALSVLYSMKGQFEKSKQYGKKALNFVGKATCDRSSALMSLASNYMLLNKLDSAKMMLDKSIRLSIDNCDSSKIVSNYTLKGELFVRYKKYNKALEYYFKALSYMGSDTSPLKKCYVYRDISVIYKTINDYTKALQFINKALDNCKANNYRKLYSQMAGYAGMYYRIDHQYDKSIAILKEGLNYPEETSKENLLISLYTELSLTYLDLSKVSKAKFYFNKAKAVAPLVHSDFFKNEFHQAKARIYFLDKDYNKSIASFNNTIRLNKKASFPKGVITGYEGLSTVYKAKKQWEKAFLYRDSIDLVQKEMDIVTQKGLIYNLESKYQNELKQAQIDQLNNEKEIQGLKLQKRNGQIIFVIIGFLLAISALLVFLNAYRVKKKSNAMLKMKNKALSNALTTNKMLIKEIHHRVKNNLQVVSSLLNLQSRFEKDDVILEAINKGKNRVQTMALLHQNLYANENLKSINVKKYFTELGESLTKDYPFEGKEIQLKTDIDDFQLDIDQVVPLGLITNELITNALKYAFDKSKKDCLLILMLKKVGSQIELKIEDNGVGVQFNELPSRSRSMGMQLVSSFSKKLKAKVKIDSTYGTAYSLKFNV